MPQIQYVAKSFKESSQVIIAQANTIIDEYLAQGFRLTLRQIYYQFVARGLLPNRQNEYKRLGSILNDARLAGLVDWEAIEDRGRNLQRIPSWGSPVDIVEACASSFQLDPWARQPKRCEVWIEKEALLGVITGVCRELRVPHFACKGYTSQSEMWESGMRIREKVQHDQPTVIFHLGDHDPSGIDMTRDVEDRLSLFAGEPVQVSRLALNMSQVEEHDPPPNPAKVTDSRFESYLALYGQSCWELDALNPEMIESLIRENVSSIIDDDAWESVMGEEEADRAILTAIANRYEDVQELVAR